MTTKSKPKTTNAFNGLNDMMATGGLGSLMDVNNHNVVQLDVAEIEVKPQDRTVFEDEEQTIVSLWESIQRNGQLQAIIVRPSASGALPYELVIGERRVRAFIHGQAPKIAGRVMELTDEQAERMQHAENIDRLNLSLVEEAKSVERDLKKCNGDVEALMAMSSKSRAWISKRLGVLQLPEAAARVITESVSADLEVIHGVAQIAKIDPEEANRLVDDLKQNAGKPGSNARTKTQDVKNKVKGPTKAAQKKKEAGGKTSSTGKPGASTAPNSELGSMQADLAALDGLMGDGAPAGTQELGGGNASGALDDVDTGSHTLNPADVPALAPQQELGEIYEDIVEHKVEPKELLKTMLPPYRAVCEDWLHSIYDAGAQAKDLSRAVMAGFRSGQFATEGHGALSLAAFLYGADSEAKFNMQNILASVKE